MATIESQNIRVEFDAQMHSRVVAKFDGKATPVGDFGPSEFVTTAASPIQDFALAGQKRENVRDARGHGRRLTITGKAGGLEKTVAVTVYDEFPRMAFFQVHYRNQSDSAHPPDRVDQQPLHRRCGGQRPNRHSGRTRAARTRIAPTG